MSVTCAYIAQVALRRRRAQGRNNHWILLELYTLLWKTSQQNTTNNSVSESSAAFQIEFEA